MDASIAKQQAALIWRNRRDGNTHLDWHPALISTNHATASCDLCVDSQKYLDDPPSSLQLEEYD
jgi:hypothetical protein